VSPRPGRAETVSEAVLISLVREGLVTPALVPTGTRPCGPPPSEKLRDVVGELGADRGDR